MDNERRGDAVVAVGAVVLCAILGTVGQPDWGWSAAMATTLVIRRSFPVTFATIAATISALHLLAEGALLFPGDAVLLVAAYSVAAQADAPRRRLGPALGLVFSAVLAGRILHGGTAPTGMAAGSVICLVALSFVASWTAGLLARRKTEALRDAEHRRLLSERDAEARTRRAADEERERISDEMHDVLAHTLTNIVIQAESGQVIAPTEEIAELFGMISRTGRSALSGVRSLLAPADDAETAPSPSLAVLDDLITDFRASGLPVDLRVLGTPEEVSPGMSLAIYRVAQESLTNALRYGTGEHAHVTLEWAAGHVMVVVSNPVDPDTGHSPIHEHRGLAGIRRRCALYGGTAHYELTDTFTLSATWPLTTGAPAELR